MRGSVQCYIGAQYIFQIRKLTELHYVREVLPFLTLPLLIQSKVFHCFPMMKVKLVAVVVYVTQSNWVTFIGDNFFCDSGSIASLSMYIYMQHIHEGTPSISLLHDKLYECVTSLCMRVEPGNILYILPPSERERERETGMGTPCTFSHSLTERQTDRDGNTLYLIPLSERETDREGALLTSQQL